jgi:PAS domain S-box-containing protein
MLLTTLSQSLPIPMVLATSAGEILMTNPAMEEFTGWSLEDFKTQGWFECLYPDPVDRARAVASVRGTFSGNLAKRAPWRITHKDGSSRNILLSSGTLPSKPDSFILGFFEPVCPYKSQEPGTDRSISFLAHELQNLLMAFQGPAEFFARTQADSPAASCLSAAFSRAQKLVHQLRAFTPSLPPLRPASLVEVVKQTLNSLPARSPRPELYAEPLLPPVDLDPASFQTLLLNLLSNTELAAPGKSPQILLQPASLPEAPLKNYAFPHMQDWVELSIEDDGPGFSEEQLAQVGQLFCSSWPGHSGLGLAAVNRIVQTHHGALHITHAPTRVSIYLPVSPHPPVEDALKLDPSAGGTERIWVLDDDDAVRDYLTSTLSAFGYRVRGFGSATDLVEAAEQEPCDLLISDLVMPGQDGMETFLNLRARGHRFPVLFCSGWPDRSLPTGRDVDFLQKPFPIRTLASRVRSLLNYTVPQ